MIALIRKHFLLTTRSIQLKYMAVVFLGLSLVLIYDDSFSVKEFKLLGFIGALMLFEAFFYMNANFFYAISLSTNTKKHINSVWIYGELLLFIFFILGLPKAIQQDMLMELSVTMLFYGAIHLPWTIFYALKGLKPQDLLDPLSKNMFSFSKLYSGRSFGLFIMHICSLLCPLVVLFIANLLSTAYPVYALFFVVLVGYVFRTKVIEKLQGFFSNYKYNLIRT